MHFLPRKARLYLPHHLSTFSRCVVFVVVYCSLQPLCHVSITIHSHLIMKMIITGRIWRQRSWRRSESTYSPILVYYFVCAESPSFRHLIITTSRIAITFQFHIWQWEAQQELLRLRNASPEVRDKYFEEVSHFIHTIPFCICRDLLAFLVTMIRYFNFVADFTIKPKNR